MPAKKTTVKRITGTATYRIIRKLSGGRVRLGDIGGDPDGWDEFIDHAHKYEAVQ